MIDQATLDERIDALVSRTASTYLSAIKSKKEMISDTQLAAVVRYTESFGLKGLVVLIDDQRRKNEKNERARNEKKGGKKAKNKEFWDSLHKVTAKELAALGAEVGQENEQELFVLFTARLAIELKYRAKVENTSRSRRR
jgi:hypothetical protein